MPRKNQKTRCFKIRKHTRKTKRGLSVVVKGHRRCRNHIWVKG